MGNILLPLKVQQFAEVKLFFDNVKQFGSSVIHAMPCESAGTLCTPVKDKNFMENGYLTSLASIGTPRARHEKSVYLQRSLSSKSSRKDDTLDPFLTNNNGTASASCSIFEMDTERIQASALMTHLSMDITADPTLMSTTAVDDNDGVEADNMFQEFLDFYLSYPGEHEVFHLLSCYEELCSDHVKGLISAMNKIPIQQKLKKTDVLTTFQNERNTWRLLNTLYRDRTEKVEGNEEEMPMDTLGKQLSDKQIINNLFLRDSCVRQSQLVVDWLEKNAAEDFTYKYCDKLEYFSDNSGSWENTLHQLKKTRTPLDKRPTRERLITELDPDAPVRQRNNILHNTDKESEIRLMKYMFVCVRAGNLEKAQEVAEKFGQPWLAASLEGWKPFHDPNYGRSNENDLLQVEGNKYRDIWKASCWRTSQEPRISVFEQAMFGVFSGNLKPILKVCETWEDCLWGYLKVFVDKLIEQELRSTTQIDRPLEELPAEYWDRDLNPNQILQELDAFPSEVVRAEGKNPYRIIQKYLILDDVDGLIEEMYNWIRRDPRPPGHLLRLMTHLILFFRMISRLSKEELCIAIIEAYVRDLIDHHKIALIASYVSTLPPSHQVIWYAKFLEGVTDSTERQYCLKFAEEAGLNIPLITKTVVENTRNRVPAESDELSGMTTQVTTEDDRLKIEAIDWLVFDQSQRAEAMKQANALMRGFVATGKLDAARQVFAKIPTDSIAVILKQSQIIGLPEPSAEDDNATREYICFRTYLEAIDAFNDWFQHFQHAKPERPTLPSDANVTFKEKVAHEHEMKLYELELARWENCLMSQTKTTSDRLYNVLLFVSGGWMVDQQTEELVDENRQHQMSVLRQICIPQITSLLHNVLYSTNQFKASVQLADIIASERYRLYKEFDLQQIQQLLSTLRESSIALLEKKTDPFGYPIP